MTLPIVTDHEVAHLYIHAHVHMRICISTYTYGKHFTTVEDCSPHKAQIVLHLSLAGAITTIHL